MRNRNDDIEKYKKGELSAAEMHALEKQALSDPFLADALEGADTVDAESFSLDVADLNRKTSAGKKTFKWAWPMRIAASLLLLLTTYFVINQWGIDKDTDLALQKPSTVKTEDASPVPEAKVNEKADSTSTHTQGEMASASKKENETIAQNEKVSSIANPTSEPSAGLGAAEKQPVTLADQSLLAEDKKVTIEEEVVAKPEALSKAAPLADDAELRKQALSQTDYKERKKLSAAPAPSVSSTQRSSNLIKGKVLSIDGSPLPGVNVVVKGTTIGTVTDANGNYEFHFPMPSPQLVFSFIGMKTKEVQTKDSKANVLLEEDAAQLSEVVVVGYGSKRDENYTPIIKRAEPVGGIKAYNRYLDNDARYPISELDKKIKGRVSLRFTVRTDGSLDSINIVKSLGKLFDEEAVRMVKEGAAWSPSTEDNVPIESEVLVRVKFDPTKARR